MYYYNSLYESISSWTDVDDVAFPKSRADNILDSMLFESSPYMFLGINTPILSPIYSHTQNLHRLSIHWRVGDLRKIRVFQQSILVFGFFISDFDSLEFE